MMSGQEVHKNLTKGKEEPSESNKKEDKYVSMLRELNNLGESISQELKDTTRIAKKIHRDASQYEMEFDVTQPIGKISVKPLADLKETATEVFADIKNNKCDKYMEKEPNYKQYYQEKENLENACVRSRNFLKLLKSSSEGLQKIFEGANKENQGNTNTSSLSDNTDPSTVNFNVFVNSATKASTSSPLEKLE